MGYTVSGDQRDRPFRALNVMSRNLIDIRCSMNKIGVTCSNFLQGLRVTGFAIATLSLVNKNICMSLWNVALGPL